MDLNEHIKSLTCLLYEGERFLLMEYIKKIGPKKWRVYSEKGKNLGTYGSLEAAKKRLKQVHYFKNR